jgi:hypothetical protein
VIGLLRWAYSLPCCEGLGREVILVAAHSEVAVTVFASPAWHRPALGCQRRRLC